MKPAAPPVTHTCAVCPRTVRPGLLMCAQCWHLVPPPLQRDVRRTWRRVELPRGAKETLERLREYRRARDAAVAAAQAEFSPTTNLELS